MTHNHFLVIVFVTKFTVDIAFVWYKRPRKNAIGSSSFPHHPVIAVAVVVDPHLPPQRPFPPSSFLL
jgi:hypothetical protein